MSTDADRAGPLEVVKSPVVVRLAAIVVGLAVFGYVAPALLGTDPGSDEFVGILVGMSWSLAALIVLVSIIMVVGSALLEAVRR